MSAITFDTLKFVERLTAAGVPESHAKAEASALAEVLSGSTRELVTKADLHQEIAEMKYDLLKWVIGIALAQSGLLIGILVKLL